MKTKTDITQYGYAILCGVNPSTIYHRVKVGELTLNDSGMIPVGTLIVKKLKLGRKKVYFAK